MDLGRKDLVVLPLIPRTPRAFQAVDCWSWRMSWVQFNSAALVGGVFAAGTDVRITDSEIVDNTGSVMYGGILVRDGVLDMERVDISRNTSPIFAGVTYFSVDGVECGDLGGCPSR